MIDLKVCRICLRGESKIKFYRIDKFYLKNHYEEIMSLPVSKVDGLPQYFCFECAAVLHKFHLFREKCYYSHNAMTEKLWNGKITRSEINSIKSKRSPKLRFGVLEILVSNKRVGTYVFEHTDHDEEKIKLDAVKDESSHEDITFDDHSFSDSEIVSNKVDIVIEPEKPEDADTKDDVRSVSEPELLLEVDTKDNFDSIPPVNNEIIKPEPLKVKKVVKKETQIKSTKKPRLSKPRQRRKRKVVKKDKYEDTDSDDEVLAKKKKTAVLERKNVEPIKTQGGKLKTMVFLDSGFWKKSILSDEEAMVEFEAKAQDKKYLKATYKCTDCYRIFSQKSMLERHIPLKHGEALGPVICRFCKCRFRTASALNRHMKLHYTKYECLRCNLVCNMDKSAFYHEEYHNGVIRKCPHCDKEFKHMSTYYTHLRTHKSQYVCTRCGESYVSELGLYLHQKVKHINDSGIVDVEAITYCEVCKIKFDTAEAYGKHLLHSAMHTEDKLLDDNTSAKDISNDNGDTSLKKKEKRPKEGEENQNSEGQQKKKLAKASSTPRKRALKAPPKITKKPTTCQYCGKHFESQSAGMKHHHAEHPRKPFHWPKDRVICEVCGASIAPGSVAAHLNQHTRLKMHTCDTCGRSFTTNNILKNHILTHTGERPHGCNFCGKRFAQSSTLKLHERTVHLKLPHPKRNRKKIIEEPNTEAGPFGVKDEYRAWRNYF